MSATLVLNKKIVETFNLPVDIAIPPEKPVIQGRITCDAVVMSKPQVKALSEEGLTDEEYLPRIVTNITGLTSSKEGANDDVLTGEAAFDEVLTGRYSMYLVQAIVEGYFSQYGEARKGNSRRRLGR